MNWDLIEGNWKQIKGKVREKWGKLTDDDLDVIAGKRDQLLGKLQERNGLKRDESGKRNRGVPKATLGQTWQKKVKIYYELPSDQTGRR